jgi:cation:H+ antiporter
MNFLPDNLLLNIGVLAVAFVLLSKGADYLVNGAVGIAHKLNIPKVIIGIVLVSFGTTMPEFTVSVISAIQDHSEIALGNAVGSVIVNVAIALALGVLVSKTVFDIDKSVYRSVGITFFGVSVVAFLLAIDGKIGRIEGGVLILGLAIYLTYLVTTEKRRKKRDIEIEAVQEVDDRVVAATLGKHILVFGAGLAVVIVSSRLLVESAVNVAEYFDVSETIIGLTIIAIGTSLPEVATCIVASRKGHGDLAFGDVMGANILNILWIVGGASVARPIIVTTREIYFMFPFMIGIVGAMFLMAKLGSRLSKPNAVILIALYIAYVIATVLMFIPR